MPPLVSIIIPIYNRTDYICEAIDSVICQTFKNFEIIVVDDGSLTNVSGFLKPYIKQVKYIYQNNKGLASARNTGIKNSQGRYIAFLDDDDLFEPCKLETQVPLLEDNPDIGFVYSDCYEFQQTRNNQKELNFAVGRNKSSTEFAKLFFMCPNVRVPVVLVKKECFDTSGFFDEMLPQDEDGDMFLRIALKWKVFFSDYPSARVRHHGNQMSLNRVSMYESIIRSTEKILAMHPEFKSELGPLADRRMSELYFELGKACMEKFMMLKALQSFRSSRIISKEFINIKNIPALFLSYILNIARQVKHRLQRKYN